MKLLCLPKNAIILQGKEVETLKKICVGCEKILQDEKLSNDFWTRLGNESQYQEIESFIKKIKAAF